jgi:hypothetical protein
MKKVLLLGSQHGDERLGDSLIRRIKLYHPDLLKYVDFCIGNPKAHRLNKRYVESDLNRSYHKKLDTYEATRANKVLAKINDGGYDLVLDLHTTTDKVEPFFIAPFKHSGSIKNFFRISPISKIVIMQHSIVNKSLIGNTDNAISIEASVHMIDKRFLESLIESIEKFIQSGLTEAKVKDFFYVDLLIDKTNYTSKQFKQMKNFELFEKSFFPILVRSASYKRYKTYRGFGATFKETKEI